MFRVPSTKRAASRIRVSGPRSATRTCGTRCKPDCHPDHRIETPESVKQSREGRRHKMSINYQTLSFEYQPCREQSGQGDADQTVYPVIVVGGGPVGLATAIDIAQQG